MTEMRRYRTKVRLRLIPALCLLAGFSSCSNSLTVGQFVPWYSSLVKKSIDFSDYLPVAYRNNQITIQRLTGPDPANLTLTRSWTIFAQQRSPEPNLVVVMDESFKPVYSTTGKVSMDTQRWMVDLNGYLILGGIRLLPPTGVSGQWQKDSFLPFYEDFYDPWLALPPNQHCRVKLYLNAAGDLYWGGPISLKINLYSSAWSTPTQPPSQLIYPLFAITNSNWEKIYGKPYTYTGGNYDIQCQSIEYDLSTNSARLFLTFITPDGISPTVVMGMPMVSPTILSQGMLSFTVLAKQSTGNGMDSYFNVNEYQTRTLPDGTFIAMFKSYDNNGNKYLPMTHNAADGGLLRQIEVISPNYTSGTGTDINGAGSSIGQQPYHISGANYWLAIDGFTQRLYVCAPWWE